MDTAADILMLPMPSPPSSPFSDVSDTVTALADIPTAAYAREFTVVSLCAQACTRDKLRAVQAVRLCHSRCMLSSVALQEDCDAFSKANAKRRPLHFIELADVPVRPNQPVRDALLELVHRGTLTLRELNMALLIEAV